MTSPAADTPMRASGLAATMTVIAMGLGYSITAADPTILSANISEVRVGLGMSPSTASFVASLATLTLAAAVLGAGALGDLYGMKRMFTGGLLGAIGFGVLAATGSGRAATRFGDRSVLVTGLLLLLAGLLMLTTVDERSSMWLLFASVVLNAVGGAVVQTPQSTIMMSSAPADLGGSVSAVKAAVGQAGYSLGPAVFALVGTTLFVHDGMRALSGSGITVPQAREALQVAHGTSVSSTGGAHVLDPQRAMEVVEGATESMIHAIHTLSLMMAAVPVAAIVLALILLRPRREEP